MKPLRDARERQKSTVFVALLLFSLILIVLQLWLFVAVLENVVAGHAAMATPATVTSAVILAVQIWMLAGVFRMNRSE